MNSTSLCLIAGSLLSACAYRSTPLLVTEDGGPSTDASTDASVADASVEARIDVGTDVGTDAGTDAGTDTGSDTFAGREFFEALSCRFDSDTALRAIAREVACAPVEERERLSTRGLLDAWEGGLFSGLEDDLFAGFPVAYGCNEWQCIAAATSCAEREACRSAGETCESGDRCNGTSFERCVYDEDPAQRRWRSRFNCASVGATCEGLDGFPQCVLDGCAFAAGGSNILECDGDDLTLCDGAARFACDDVAPGAVCASLAVGGEAPTQFCNPSGERSTAGVYAFPNDCSGGVVTFTSVSEIDYRFDCVAAGYSGCDDRGCVL